MTSPATTDLCDAYPDIQVCDPVFRTFGGRPSFSGPITTLKVFEDNTMIKEAVEGQGEGRVLVVDRLLDQRVVLEHLQRRDRPAEGTPAAEGPEYRVADLDVGIGVAQVGGGGAGHARLALGR